MLSKKTLFATGGILAIFLVMCVSQGAAATSVLPTYLSAKATIHGYSLVYNDSITVDDFENTNVNVTCWTTMWYRPTNATVNSSIIGASLVDAGGRVLDKAINISGSDTNSKIARAFLTIAGFNSTQIAGISTVWDVFFGMLQVMSQNSTGNNTFTVQSLTLAKADHALLISTPDRPLLSHILFATKGTYMLLAFDYNLQNWTVDWTNAGNVTAMGAYIKARFQSDVWFLWRMIGSWLKFLNRAANLLSSSSVIAAVPASSSIMPASNTPLTDLQAFANGWASLAGSGSIPGYDPAMVVMAVAASGAMIVAFKVRKSKRT
jgi:hypothetical protein